MKALKKILLSLLAIVLVVSSNSYSMKRPRSNFPADDVKEEQKIEDRICLICQEKIGDVVDYAKSENCTCNSIFHTECLTNWFRNELAYDEEAIVDGMAVQIRTNPEEKDVKFQKGCPVCRAPGSIETIQIFKKEDQTSRRITRCRREEELPAAVAVELEDDEFLRALELSEQQQRLDEQLRRERDEEDEELFQAIAMSLEDHRVEGAVEAVGVPQPSWFSRFWPFGRS